MTMETNVADNRTNSSEEDEACWVAQAQAWRMKMEVAIRRERSNLAEHTRVAGKRQVALARASRDARVVEKVIENIDDEQSRTDRRNETCRLDAMGAQRWHRKDG